MKTRRLGTVVGIACLLAACGAQDAAPPSPAAAPTLALAECRVPGVETAVRCGTLVVPEDREAGGGNGRRIPINVVVLPASSRSRLPDPIFFFAGGPSQAASDFARPALAMFGALASKRDIVLVDQRGTGKSNGLFCKSGDAWEVAAMESARRVARSTELLRACRDELSKKADLTMYTTTRAMADIDAVRAALGYSQINLWGGSYGTRAAQEYLRRYPAHVRSVILDGVVPPSLALPEQFSRDAAAAFARGGEACQRDPACKARYGDWATDAVALMAELKAKPRRIEVADPFDGRPRTLLADDEAIKGVLFSTLYAPEALAMIPNALRRARAGDFGPLVTLSSLIAGDGEDKNAMGMRLSVMCAEDIPRLAPANPPGPEPFGDLFVREFRRSCEGWPRGPVPADFSTPVSSDKPVLLLSGAADPVTPPPHAEEVRRTFPNSVHLVAANLGHGVSGKGCAPKLIKQFIDKAAIAGIDGSCLNRLPRPGVFEPPQRDAGAVERSRP